MSLQPDPVPPAAARCPVCGGTLAPTAPRGLCPRCLLMGVAAPTADRATESSSGRPQPPDLARLAAAFPQLEILRLLGAGGMGAVYLARQPHLDRMVALKVLPESLAARPAFAERFQREARVLARLNHPNIVTVHDFGQAGGFFFLLMEYVDGVNLRQAMQAGRFTPAQALELIPRICEALQFAHDEGILHRDIKPENLLLDTRGRVKIADFGIAKLIGESPAEVTLTASGAAIGTPAYMAPEQIERPADVDHRADLYSLGVVLYELLTGELPLGRFAPPSEKTPVDHRVDALVFRALEKEREKRFQSATEVRTRVESLQSPASPAAVPEVPSPKSPPPPVPNPAPAPAPAPASAPVSAVPDFILCHPALPRMAQAICVYGLVIFPFIFLVSLPLMTLESHLNPYAAFAAHLTALVTWGGELMFLPLVAAGSWMLRQLRPRAPAWIRRSLWLHLVLLAATLLGSIWVETLRRDADPAPAVTPADLLLVGLGLAGMGFEIAALIWLYRYRQPLDAALDRGRLAAASSPTGLPAEVYLAQPPPAARHATLGATLTALGLGLGLPALSAARLGLFTYLTGPGNNGISVVALLVLLALLTLGLGFGVAGLVAGHRSLADLRSSAQPRSGHRRAQFAAWAGPLVITALVSGSLAGSAFFRFLDSPLTALFASLLVALATVECVVRFRVRPVNSSDPRSVSSSRVWIHGLAAAAVVAAALTAVPAGSVLFANALRHRLPPMIVSLVGDPGVPPGTNSTRLTMQLEVGCPPRSVLFLRTVLFRDGQALRSPLSEDHLINPGLVPARASLGIRVVAPSSAAPGTGTETATGDSGIEWELVHRLDRHNRTFGYRAEETRGIEWSPVGIPQWDSRPVGSPFDLEILRGRGPDGAVWSTRLVIQSEALQPSVEVTEEPLLGDGRDWPGTLRNAHPPASRP